MGGDDSQKLRPWRGTISSPGRSRPPAHNRINTVAQTQLFLAASAGTERDGSVS